MSSAFMETGVYPSIQNEGCQQFKLCAIHLFVEPLIIEAYVFREQCDREQALEDFKTGTA